MISAFSTLRARVALLVLLATVPLVALSSYNNLQQRRQARERAGEAALHLVHLARGNEQEIVEGTRQLLIALAQLPEVRGDDPQACSALLARIRDRSQRYANLGVIDRDGRVFCSAVPFSRPVLANDRAYFREALDEGIFSVGEYQVGRITGRPSVNFGYPVLQEGGDVHAVVFAALDLAWLNELAAAQTLQEGAVLLTMDNQGAILTYFPDAGPWIGQRLPDGPLAQVILSRGGAGTIESVGLDGMPRLYAYAPLDDQSAGLFVAAGIPTSVAYAAADRALVRNLTALAILTVIFLAAAWAFAHRFVLRPVHSLARAAERITAGEMDARSELSYDDGEFGRLARTFDAMAHSLASRLRRLQAVNAIDRAITARYELPQLLDVVLEQVVSQLHVDAAAILLLDEQEGVLQVAASRGFRSPDLLNVRLAPDESYSRRVLQEQRPCYVADLRDAADLVAPRKAAEGFVSYAGAPLIAEGRLQGVLGVYHRSQLSLEEEWKRFLEALALQAGIAIDNARLLRESQRLLEKSREQALQVQQIVDTMPEGVLLLDSQRRVLLANPLARRYLAQLADAAVGDQLVTLGDLHMTDLLDPVGEDEPWHELALPGEGQIFELASQPVRHDDHLDGWVVVLRNVTEERERQEHVHTQGRLATVGQLAAGIAHDFNNIMAVILLYGQALSANPDHPRREEYLRTAVEQAQRAATLINQILDFSRDGAVERRRLELGAFARELIHLLQRTLPESIAISLDDDGCDYVVKADPARLQQVVMNLAINARDAMPGGGHLTIALHPVEIGDNDLSSLPDLAPGAYVGLSISDTGSGIAPDVLPRIYEPFFTTKPRGQGTGLGLAQAYGILKQHEGLIDVQTEVGKGTTFTLYLPALVAPSDVDSRSETDVEPLSGSGVVLLVEDDAGTRTAVAGTLSEMGYDVLEAATGRQALTLLQQHPGVDLVLSDIVMPDMDGLVLRQSVRETYPDLALLLMSGYPLQDEVIGPTHNGPLTWLKKPFTAGELAKHIRRAMSKPASAEQANVE